MRVTHVITRLVTGGAQENTVATVLGLNQKPGVQAGLITGPSLGPEGSLEGMFQNRPGLLLILPSLVRPIRPWSDLSATRALERIFRAEQPRIVHTHSGKAGIVGRLAARRARVPVIVHTVHGPSFGPFQGPAANLLFKTAERLAAHWTTHFISVAQAMTDQYLQAGIGKPEQFTRIWSGFNLEPFLSSSNDLGLRRSLGIAPEDLVVGKIARLFALKGHDDLLKAAPALIRAFPNIKFLLVGDGALRPRFEELVRARGWQSHFVFTGLVPPGKVPSLVGIMDILVHLSLREGLPRALPQALAAGKPVVAYDCDGAREVCLHGRTGCLVRPGEVQGFVQGVLRLGQDPALRARLGAQGREMVRHLFSTQRMVDEIHALYLRLLKA